jgi:hypothetical protein
LKTGAAPIEFILYEQAERFEERQLMAVHL